MQYKLVTVILFHRRHHGHRIHCLVYIRRRRKFRHNPIPQHRIHDACVHKLQHLARHECGVSRVAASDDKLLGIWAHKEVELHEDSGPDVVRAEDEGAMVIVRLKHGMHKSVGLWHDITHRMEFSGERRAKEVETARELFRGSLFEDGEVGVLVEWDLETVVFCERLGGMGGWAE
jgi:hypothetical protein